MARYITSTKEYGEVTFIAPGADERKSAYVWLKTDEQPRRQICYGGDFRGGTVTATEGSLKKVAQKWMRERRAWQRKYGIEY